MASQYTSWIGLTDQTFTGRHLPEYNQKPNLPSESELVDLFIRPEKTPNNSPQQNCIRSTLMFAAFAQWFTDSFLRTSHHFIYDKNGNVIRNPDGSHVRRPGREKKNISNHEIDLCQIYGMSEKETNLLRLKDQTRPGLLKFQQTDDGEFPEFLLSKKPKNSKSPLNISSDFDGLHDEQIIRSIFAKADNNVKGYETIFAVGLEHGNATIGNSLLNTIFLREHNRVARLIAKDNPKWDDERIFQTTRNVMIVLLLNIVISDYIKHISPNQIPFEFQPNFAEHQTWYRKNRISIEFNLLYRWHGLVPDEFSFLPNPKDPNAFRHNNNWLMKNGLSKSISAFSNERAGKITLGNTPRYLKGVKADTIKLMRDSNLAPYNDYRERFGLPRAENFSDVTKDRPTERKLSSLYNNDITSLEWYIGLFAEYHSSDMIMGDFLMTMVAHDAFTHALTNPLLASSVFKESTFSKKGWEIIHSTKSLNDIVQRVKTPNVSVKCSFSI